MKAALSLALPVLAAASPLLSVGTIHKDAAPILSSTGAKEVPDSYIVVLKDHVDSARAEHHRNWVKNMHESTEISRTDLRKRSQLPTLDAAYAGLKHTYDIAGELLGYSGHFHEDVIEQIRNHPDVDFIERDSIVHTLGDEGDIENNAPWGLARVSHRKGLSFGTFNKYAYADQGGEGVDVYVIDTGTYVDHVDFEGRASWGKTIPDGDVDLDGNGHGTHCSGTIAGKKYGVAKKAHVKAVKVLGSGGSGTMSDVISGVEWAALAHLEEVKKAKAGKRKGFKGSAANMSLGGGKSVALERTLNAAVKSGVSFAVAAGNENQDACNTSPAAAEKAVTVGASTFDDTRAYFSNYGSCVDIFGPGLNVLSTWIGSPYAVNTISGTSMASPHIAGLLAYFLSLQPASDSAYAVAITPDQLKKNLIAIATEGVLTDIPEDTPNLLAWNGGGSSNYSDIIGKGGYRFERQDETEKFSKVEVYIEDLEHEMKHLAHESADEAKHVAHAIKSEVEDEAELVSEDLRKLSTDIKKAIAAELETLVEELRD